MFEVNHWRGAARLVTPSQRWLKGSAAGADCIRFAKLLSAKHNVNKVGSLNPFPKMYPKVNLGVTSEGNFELVINLQLTTTIPKQSIL